MTIEHAIRFQERPFRKVPPAWRVRLLYLLAMGNGNGGEECAHWRSRASLAEILSTNEQELSRFIAQGKRLGFIYTRKFRDEKGRHVPGFYFDLDRLNHFSGSGWDAPHKSQPARKAKTATKNNDAEIIPHPRLSVVDNRP